MTDKHKKDAPDIAQPDLTQQTLDDVKAGIPVRDAEIAELRKEIETLRAQQDADKVAGSVREPVNGDGWRVHWWNESMRLMLPDGSHIHHANIFKNGTKVITIKTDAARKERT